MLKEEDKKIRNRNWFITINPNAHCYKNIEEIIKSYKYNHYAYIYHKADEDNVNDNHIHIVLELQNARTWESIANKFEGAHIEIAKYKYQCYKYLIHKESDNKTKYNIEDIKTDSIEYYKECIVSNEYEKLDTKEILKDIANGVNTITEFVKKYGLYQVSRFTGILNNLIRENDYINRIQNLEETIKQQEDHINELEEINKDLQECINKDLPF